MATTSALETAHFFECLQSGTPFRTTVADGVKAQILADAASRCAAERPQTVGRLQTTAARSYA